MLSILTFLKNSKKMNRTSKNEILLHGVLLCVLVVRKNDKLYICQNLQKKSRKGVSSINIYMFQVKRPRYDHFRGIVCDNMPIFGTYVYLGMGNNVTELSFFKKNYKYYISFSKCQKQLFCEASTQNIMQNDTHPIFTQISPYLKDNIKILEIFSLST